eukprot:CAMPEP_0206454104 /NCGR_PEP_ID=MMETSP0324_2-20121206/20943_1 /ASSEMBLY_ACC=CAM_ASM_000836 /TAXON_ID=2866 /ORGANISM="Crypthecodinium cohnii, Strain Seligo" /LENGTH=283 /DNA_ID=CAMNT_0053924523 /DNA_START=87 /DNA_END=935 /DNA_ORIENTATION=+
MMGGTTPLDLYQKSTQKQDIQAQFSEDIRHVINGGYGDQSRGDNVGCSTRRSGMRARSPGLAAGAALTLGGVAAAGQTAGSNFSGASDTHDIARQLRERNRGSGCPFDDHLAFEKHQNSRPWATSEEPVRHIRAPSPAAAQEAYAGARAVGRRNREAQLKIGSTAPFDAPETSFPESSYGAAAAGVAATAAQVAAGAPTSFVEAQKEAAANRRRMAGTDNLLAGGYIQGDMRTAAPVGRSSKPPPAPERMLPQAMLKAQMDNLGPVDQDRAAYLNSKVLGEAC